jgi:large subunit ribosomal protein L6
MSRVGKKPVTIPGGVSVAVADNRVQVKGPKGTLDSHILLGTTVTVDGGEVRVTAERIVRNPAFGTMRALIQNMVTGVERGIQQGARDRRDGLPREHGRQEPRVAARILAPIHFDPPEGITIKTESPTRIVISGSDKALVGRSRRTSAPTVLPSRTRARA